MAKSKIFIASSGRTLVLAEMLKSALKTDFCEATVWRQESENKPSNVIIEMLKSATLKYDFAVVILAQDDMVAREAMDVSVWKPRDNCVFEAGLFMGALGVERCFLVNSVKYENLPSDLSGLIPIPFKEPTKLGNYDACGEEISDAAIIIKRSVQNKGPISRPLSRQELLEREKAKTKDGDLFEGEVVVASVEPLELGDNAYSAVRQVRENITGNIRYVYFFQGDDDGADKICLLLQLILLCGVGCTEEQAKDFRKRLDVLKCKQNEILAALKDICDKGGLRIYLLPARPDLEYCIHNATRKEEARLYVRHRELFTKWESGPAANQFWKDVRTIHGIEDSPVTLAVLCGAAGFTVNEGHFFRKLNAEMTRYFSVIAEQVMKLCSRGARRTTEARSTGGCGCRHGSAERWVILHERRTAENGARRK